MNSSQSNHGIVLKCRCVSVHVNERERKIFSRYRFSAEVSVWDFMVARVVKGIPCDVWFTFCLQTTNENFAESNNTKSISHKKKWRAAIKCFVHACEFAFVYPCSRVSVCLCVCICLFASLTSIERVCVLRMHSYTYCHIVQRCFCFNIDNLPLSAAAIFCLQHTHVCKC